MFIAILLVIAVATAIFFMAYYFAETEPSWWPPVGPSVVVFFLGLFVGDFMGWLVDSENFEVFPSYAWPIVLLVGFAAGRMRARGILAEKIQRERESERKAIADERSRIRQRANDAVKSTQAAMNRLPAHLESAESNLNRASLEFAARAYSPFWDAIERALVDLGRFREDVASIEQGLRTHQDCLQKLREQGEFPVVLRIPSTTGTLDTLDSVVYRAQRDFEFAQIFEQKRTQKILIQGFEHLGQAVDAMGARISSDLQKLSEQVEYQSYVLGSKLGEILASSDSAHGVLSEEISERRKHERKELEILDNIQRRRRPK